MLQELQTKTLEKGPKKYIIQRATSKFPRQQALDPLQGWASSREAWKRTILKEHKSNKSNSESNLSRKRAILNFNFQTKMILEFRVQPVDPGG